MTPENTPHLSGFDLDLMITPEVDPALRQRVQGHLDRCRTCAEELASRRQLANTFATTVFPRSLSHVQERVLNTQEFGLVRRIKRLLTKPLPWLAVAAAAMGILLLRPQDKPDAPIADLVTKGEGDLVVVVRRPQGVVMFDRWHREVSPGEEVRFIIENSPANFGYVMVGSVDTKGNALILFPFEGQESAAVTQQGRLEIPGSLVLDDTLGPEQIFAVFSRKPIAAARLRDALKTLSTAGVDAIRDTFKLPLPGEETEQFSYMMFKQPAGAPH